MPRKDTSTPKPSNDSDSDTTRVRPIPESMIPPADQMKRVKPIRDRIESSLNAAVRSIDELEHAIVRAIVVGQALKEIDTIREDLMAIRQEALIQAYEHGQAESGWYGYAAIGEQVDLSTARVRQIIHDMQPGQNKPTQSTAKSRDEIRRIREARRLIAQGYSRAQVSRETGLTPSEIRKLDP